MRTYTLIVKEAVVVEPGKGVGDVGVIDRK